MGAGKQPAEAAGARDVLGGLEVTRTRQLSRGVRWISIRRALVFKQLGRHDMTRPDLRMLSIVICCLALGLGAAQAGYNVRANVVQGALDTVHSIAVGPGVCPADFDCLWLERKLEEQLQGYSRFAFVPTDRVRQAMLELGIDHLDDGSRVRLAETLRVDAFLVPVIGHSGKESAGAVGIWTGYTFVMADSSVAKGNVELILLGAADGKTLFKGSGFGESEWRTGKGVALKIVREILIKTFGSPQR